MIVWLASFPRSGNTFTRIVLHHLYDVPTYTEKAAADDLSYDKGAGDLTGNRDLSELWPDGRQPEDWDAFIRSLEESDKVYFIKTHANARMLTKHKDYRTILLVRHGMDVFVSLANYFVDVYYTWPRFRKKWFPLGPGNLLPKRLKWMFRDILTTWHCSRAREGAKRAKMVNQFLQGEINRGGWKRFHESWMDRKEPNLVPVRFDDLIANPIDVMQNAVEQLGVDLPFKGGEIPSFEELKKVHPKFFRKGRSNTWKTEFPEEMQSRFWQNYGSTMSKLGFEIQG